MCVKGKTLLLEGRGRTTSGMSYMKVSRKCLSEMATACTATKGNVRPKVQGFVVIMTKQNKTKQNRTKHVRPNDQQKNRTPARSCRRSRRFLPRCLGTPRFGSTSPRPFSTASLTPCRLEVHPTRCSAEKKERTGIHKKHGREEEMKAEGAMEWTAEEMVKGTMKGMMEGTTGGTNV